jgi:hypothetical protein
VSDITDFLVLEVEEAFKREEGAQGEAFVEAQEATNAALRTAWPFVVKRLNG